MLYVYIRDFSLHLFSSTKAVFFACIVKVVYNVLLHADEKTLLLPHMQL